MSAAGPKAGHGPASGRTRVDRPRGLPGRLVWLPALLLLVAILSARAAGLREVYELPRLRLVLSFVFYTLVSLGTLYLVGRSFLASGAPGLLLLGCGALLWSAAGTVGDAVSHGDANINVTIFNSCILLSGLCHLAAVAVTLRPQRPLRSTPLWLGVGCAVTLAILWWVTQATLAHRLPVFFVQGTGGTPVRYGVLSSAVSAFALSAALLLPGARAPRVPFTSWYAPALMLMAVGLFGIMIQLSLGSVVNWLSRASQWLGGVYLLFAAAAALRESHLSLLPPGKDPGRSLYGEAVAVVAVLTAGAVRMAFLQVLGTHAPYVVFYPAVVVAALYGGGRAGLLATALSAVMVDYFWVAPPGQLKVGQLEDWLAMAVFALSGAMISYVTEAMRDAQARARDADAKVQIAMARQRDMEALRASEEKFSTMFHSTPLATALITLPGGVLYDVNRAWLELLGFARREDAVGRTTAELGVERDPEAREHALDEVRRRGSLRNLEMSVVTRTGDVRVLLANLDRVEIAGSEFILSAMQDFTDRKRAEEALQRSEERFRMVIENSRDGINLLDLESGRYVIMSPSQLELTGFTAEEMGDLSAEEALERVHPDDRDRSVVQQRRLSSGQESGNAVEYRWKVKSGEYRWFSDSRKVVRDATGRPVALVGLSRDITERKQAEEELRQLNETLEHRVAGRTAELRLSEERFRQMAENVREVFWLASADMRQMLYVSPAFETIWGRRPQEVYDDPGLWFELVHPEDRPGVRAAFLVQPPIVASMEAEYRILRPDGATCWISDHAAPVRDPSGRVYRIAGTARDITAHKQTQQALERAYRHLTTETQQRHELERQVLEISEREQRRIGQDLHDGLGQRLGGAVYQLSALARRLEKDESPEAARASQLERELRHALDEVRQIARGLHPVRPDAEGLMSALHELAGSAAKSFRVPCAFTCEFPVLVHDPRVAINLFRIAQEAVNNAVRHGRPRHIGITLEETDGGVRLRVEDDGRGLPADPKPSTGLGMRIMKYRASEIDATWAVAARGGGGTVVTCDWRISAEGTSGR